MDHRIKLLFSYRKFHSIRKLFDGGAYLTLYPDIKGNKLHPLLHYLEFGKFEGRFPMPLFDPIFYRNKYMDADDPLDPLVHYLRHPGETRDTHVLFDAVYYANQLSDNILSITLLEHFLQTGWKQGISPTPYFDASYYLESNPDVKGSGFNPLLHYLLFGEREGRWPNPFFDPELYRRPTLSEGENYAVYHGRSKLEFFALRDMKTHFGINHFFQRLGLEPRKPVVLFVSHEGSRTGAPLIILELARKLKERYEILPVNILLRGGELETDFDLVGPTYCSHHFWTSLDGFVNEIRILLSGLKNFEIYGALVNSAESRRILPVFSESGIRCISLIHEMAEFYPVGSWQEINDLSEKVIFPSGIVRDLALLNSKFDRHKTVVIGQGLLDEKRLINHTKTARKEIRRSLGLERDAFIVLGCGTAIPRKGIDFFVHIGITYFRRFANSNQQVYFVWLGTLPDNDLLNWALFDLQRSGLEDKIVFPGPTEDTTPYFEGSDIFFMTSRADPFPCVVHEAMAAGLPIIAFDGGGGYVEAIEGGGGTILPYGDILSVAEAIDGLVKDNYLRSRKGKEARLKVAEVYDFEKYAQVIGNYLSDVGAGPLKMTGGKGRARTGRPLKKVIFTLPDWWISGVNTFVENLVRELNDSGYEAYILFTTMRIATADESLLPQVPYRFLYPASDEPEDIWKKLKKYLEENTPCVFVPNYDYIASAISADLSNDVGILGVLHSDDVEHYEHAHRLGRYWNHTISVSKSIHRKLLEINPGFASRSSVIYYGVAAPQHDPTPLRKLDKFSIIYSGRIVAYQKRIFDFIAIIEKLDRLGLDFVFTFIGDGEDAKDLKRELAKFILSGKVRWLGRQSQDVVFAELEQHHVVALTSDFEGLPLSVLEGLARFCIPVVTDIESGINEILTHKFNGMISPIGNTDTFVENLLWLNEQVDQRIEMAKNAYNTVAKFELTQKQMGQKYAEVIDSILLEVRRGKYKRPEALNYRSKFGKILPPPMIQEVRK